MSQKTDGLIKLALVFFVSLLSFSIGTYVGKKYSDNQHKLALLEPKSETPAAHTTGEEFATEVPAAHGEETAEGHGAAPHDVTAAKTGSTEDVLGTHKPAALTDSEVAQLAEEFATNDEEEGTPVGSIAPDEKPVGTIANHSAHAATPTKVAAVKNAEVPTATTPVSAPKAVAKAPTLIKKSTPALIEDEDRIPASVTAKPTATPTANKKEITPMHFTVQIGSYPTEAEAMDITQELQGKGYKTTYVSAKVNGKSWYRVSVGLFGSIKEAQDYKKEFLEKTKMTSAIIQRVQ